MSEPFLGEIKMFGGSYAPYNYALCNGQLVPVRQYTALFSILGTTFGGDGVNTFGFPNLGGRTVLGMGQGPGLTSRPLGQMGGEDIVTLTSQTIPTHTHTAGANDGAGNKADPGAAVVAQAHVLRETSNLYSPDTGTQKPPPTLNPNTLPPVGSGMPHRNLPPYLTINFIISLAGVFPQRPPS